ncbi:MAG: alpha/beta fold hydrolase [Baekduiaceae bacterium]
MPQITLPQGVIEYRENGVGDSDAPVVVFVHGFLVDGSLWAATADALARRGIRAIAPTLPLGSPRPAMRPDADLSPRGVARVVIAFLEALDLHDVTLVGNDSGGAISQFVLDTDPSRVGRLVLTNCDAFDTFPPAPFDVMFRIARRRGVLRAGLEPMRLRALRHSVLGYGVLSARPFDAEQTRGWVMPFLSDAGVRRDTLRFLRAAEPADLLDVSTRLSRFTRPVLLCWAPQDRFFRIELGRRLAAVFPDARLVEIGDARTFVPLDQPERLAAEIAAFAPVPGANMAPAEGLMH